MPSIPVKSKPLAIGNFVNAIKAGKNPTDIPTALALEQLNNLLTSGLNVDIPAAEVAGADNNVTINGVLVTY